MRTAARLLWLLAWVGSPARAQTPDELGKAAEARRLVTEAERVQQQGQFAQAIVPMKGRVDDQATRELMSRYCAALLAGQGRAAALRQWAREVRKRRPHPYFWAPFVAVGRGEPLRGK